MPPVDDQTVEEVVEQDSPVEEEATESVPEDEATSEDETAEAEDETEETEDESATAEEVAETAYQKLLKKYGGDKEKMAEAVFASYNSTAELKKQLDNITRFIEGQSKPQVSEEEIVQQDQAVQGLIKQYKKVKSELDVVQTEYTQNVTKYANLERKIERLSGKLEAADFEAQPAIKEELKEVTAEWKEVRSELKSAKQTEANLIERLENIKQKGIAAEKQAKLRAKEEAERQEEQAREAQQLRGQYVTAMEQEAARYGLDVESKKYKHLLKVNHGNIVAYLSSLPPNAPGIDIDHAVKVLMAEWADVNGVKAKFQKASAAKRQATTPTQSTTSVATKAKSEAPPKDGKWTADYARKRAERLLG